MVNNIVAIILVIFLLQTSLVAQNIKKYNGVYNNGKALYEYYENENFERIYHGTFVFTTPKSKLEGYFKNNMKDGIWKFTSTNSTNYQLENIILTGSFNDGQMNGVWKYIKIIKDKKGRTILKDIKSADFRNNKFKGDVIDRNITIHISDDGFIDKVMPIRYSVDGKPYEALFEFREGILSKSFVRNLSNGEIIEQYDKTELVEKFNELFTEEKKAVVINKRSYTKEIYSLDFMDKNDATEFLLGSISSHSNCAITEMVEGIKLDNNMIFNFQTLFSSRSEAYDALASAFLFWFDIISGKFYNLPKGNDGKLIYPEIAFSNLIKLDKRIMKNYSTEEIIDESIEFESKISDVKKTNIPRDEVFEFAEQGPEFPGGEDSLKAYLANNLRYPYRVLSNEISGSVIVNFIVNENGEISNTKVARGIERECDEEAVRLIKNMPFWIPGKVNNKPVKVSFSLRIEFIYD